MSRSITRRRISAGRRRGALAAVARIARAETAARASSEVPRRFLPIYLPNGAHEFWRPATSGSGDAWQLSSILEPFGASLKPKLNVVTNLENGSVFNGDGSSHVESSHGRLGGAWLTCVDAAASGKHSGSTRPMAFRSTRYWRSTQLPGQDGARIPAGGPIHPLQQLRRRALFQQPQRLVGQRHAAHVQARRSARGLQSDRRRRAPARPDRRRRHRGAKTPGPQQERARCGSGERAENARAARRERPAAHGPVSGSVRAVERRVVGVSAGMGGVPVPCRRAPTCPASSNRPRRPVRRPDLQQRAPCRRHERIDRDGLRVRRHPRHLLHAGGRAFGVHLRPRARTGLHRGELEPKGGACPEYHAAQHDGGDVFATITWWNVGKVARALPQARRHQGRAKDQRARQLGRLPGRVHARRQSRGRQAAGGADRRWQPWA